MRAGLLATKVHLLTCRRCLRWCEHQVASLPHPRPRAALTQTPMQLEPGARRCGIDDGEPRGCWPDCRSHGCALDRLCQGLRASRYSARSLSQWGRRDMCPIPPPEWVCHASCQRGFTDANGGRDCGEIVLAHRPDRSHVRRPRSVLNWRSGRCRLLFVCDAGGRAEPRFVVHYNKRDHIH